MAYAEVHVIVGDEWAIGRGAEFVERSSHVQQNQALVGYYYDYFGAGPSPTSERIFSSLNPVGLVTGSGWNGIEHTLGANLASFPAIGTNQNNLVYPSILKVALDGATLANMKPGGSVYERLLLDVEDMISELKASNLEVYFRTVTLMAGAAASKAASHTIAEESILDFDVVLVALRSIPWFGAADFFVFAPHPNMALQPPFSFAKTVREAAIWAASRNGAMVLDGAYFDARFSGVAPEASLNGNAYHDMGHHLASLIHSTRSERNYTHKPDLSYGYKVYSDFGPNAPSPSAMLSAISVSQGAVGRDDARNKRSIVSRTGRGRNDEGLGSISRAFTLKPITGDRLLRFWPEDEVEEQLVLSGASQGIDFRPDYQTIWPPGIGPVSSPFDVCFYDGEWFPFTGQNSYMDELAVAPRVVSWVRADLCTTAAQKKAGNISAFNDLAIGKGGAPNDTIRGWTPQGAIPVRRHRALKDQWAFQFDSNLDRIQTTVATHPSGGERGFHAFMVCTPLTTPLTSKYLMGTGNPNTGGAGNENLLALYLESNGAVASSIVNAAGTSYQYIPTGVGSPRLITLNECHIMEAAWSANLNYKTIARMNGSQVWDSGDVTITAAGTFSRRTTATWYVGNTATYANSFLGSIAEWIIYEGHLSWRQRMGVIAYLWERYGARLETFF